MLIDSIELMGGKISRGIIESGTSFPTSPAPQAGQLFFMESGTIGLYTFNGAEWVANSGSTGGGSPGDFDETTFWMEAD